MVVIGCLRIVLGPCKGLIWQGLPDQSQALAPGPQRPATLPIPKAKPQAKPQAKPMPEGKGNNPKVFPKNMAGAGSTFSGDLVRIG